jgi:hypothetical protein
MVSVFSAEPAVRSCCQSGSSAMTAPDFARIVAVACPRLRRS